jgi:outer membrane biosynthesis protein TonB
MAPLAFAPTNVPVYHPAPPPPPAAPVFTLQDGLIYVYILGVAIALTVFLFRLYQLFKLSRSNKTFKDDNYQIIHLKSDNTAFSFFNYLFIGTNISQSETIIAHELVHIRQKHSWDIMLLEVLKVINWFTPFVYLVQRSIKTVHEYIADEQTAAYERDALTYSSFLLNNAYGIQGSTIAHSFFNYNLLKKRIIMLNKNRSGKLARLKYLTVLPLCAGMLCASSLAFAKDYGWVDLMPRETPKTTAVIDTIKHKLPPPPPPTFLKEPFRGLDNYLKNTVEYPKAAFDKKLNGSVLLSFNLDKAGMIDNVKVIDDPGNSFSEPVVKYLSAYPLKIKSKAGSYKIGVDFNMADGDYVSIFSNPKIKGDQTFVGEIIIVGMTDAQRMQTPPNPPSPAPRKITKKLPPPPAPPTMKAGKIKFPPPAHTMVKPDKVTSANKLLPPPPPHDPVYTDLMKYVARHVRYPAAAREKNLTGNVLVSLRIDDTHKITDLKIINGIGSGCDEEVIRALKSYQETVSQIPGMYRLMVSFALTGEKGARSYYPEPVTSNIAGSKDFIGQIIIVGYVTEAKQVQ